MARLKLFLAGFGLLAIQLIPSGAVFAADTVESLVAGAKKEEELVFVAGAGTFGGRKGLSDLEAAFNKRYSLKMRIAFAAGPDMNARAARHNALRPAFWVPPFQQWLERG
jgi:hypothetical protein